MELNIKNFDRGLLPEIADSLLEFETFQDPELFADWLEWPGIATLELLELLPDQVTPGDHKEAFLAELYRRTGRNFLLDLVHLLEAKARARHENGND